MPNEPETFLRNNLLAALSKSDFELLKSKLDWIDLKLGDLLYIANQPFDYAYFPTSGICSIIADNSQGVKIETGVIGREGFVGIPIIHFADSAPSQVLVQGEGRALRISRDQLLKAVQKSPSLLKVLLQFAHVFATQVAQTAVANGHYTINQRLARWLLLCQDREESHEFRLTHHFLSLMLAVRRAGVTDALSYLEGKKAIRAMRGRIVIINRACLEEIAGAVYGVSEKEYERLIGKIA
jgi:CRP-like cAMP-binding protein